MNPIHSPKNQYLELIQSLLFSLKQMHAASPIFISSPELCAFFKSPEKSNLEQRSKTPLPMKPSKSPVLPSPQVFSKPISTPPPNEPLIKHSAAESPAPNNLKNRDENKFQPPQELKLLVQKILPALKVTDHIPDDRLAKSLACQWKEEIFRIQVAIFHGKEKDQEVDFLKNVAKAIDSSLLPAALFDASSFDKDQKWDLIQSQDLHLIIASPRVLSDYLEFKRHYKEIPATQEKFFGKTPLLILSPLSDYFKNPQTKKALWHHLCQILKKQPLPQ